MTSTAAEKKMAVEVLEKKMAEEVLEKKIPEEVLEKKMAEELLDKKKMPEEEEGRKYKRRRKYKRKRKYIRKMKNKRKRKNKWKKKPNKTFDSDGSVWTFEEGKTYNISLLLSGRTTNRNYLINNKGVQVNIRQLSGKYILLYVMSLPDDPRHSHYHMSAPLFYGDLEELYNIHSPQGMFEVVVVALGNNKNVFCETFSQMPWLAIPHKDQDSRDIFKIEFDIPYPSSMRAVPFAPNGTLVLANAIRMISYYGAHGFPFTNQRLCVLLDECHALREEFFLNKRIPALTALVGDYVISSDGNKDPTSRLEGKIVGLYVF